MIIQHRDGTIVAEDGHPFLTMTAVGYYGEVPSHSIEEQSTLIDRMVTFALDRLNAYYVELRVFAEEDVA